VRIGVEEAVDDDLMKVGAHQLAAEPLRIEIDTHHGADLCDLGPEHEVHRQHARRRVVVDGLRDDDRGKGLQIAAEHLEVRGLVHVIELVEQRCLELGDHFREIVAFARVAVAIDERCNLGERDEIVENLRLDTGPLHLHGDEPAVAQRGGVHLTERGGRDRGSFEQTVGFGDSDAELGLDDPLDVGVRKRFDVVL
jgi:hypothetical protein